MSDLTRRVLAIVQTDPVVTVCTVPDNDVAVLARQVEAVENELCKAEDRIGPTVEDDYSGGIAYMINSIRRALTDTGRN